MIHPTPFGFDVVLLLTSGETAVYRIHTGFESQAMRVVLNHHHDKRLNAVEAGLLLCAIERLTHRPSCSTSKGMMRSSLLSEVGAFIRLFVRTLIRDVVDALTGRRVK